MIFYFNLGSQIIFMLVSRMCRFRTLAERHKFGGNKRYQVDWLFHVKDDVHWFNILIIEIALCIYGCSVRAHKDVYDISLTFTLVLIQLAICTFIVFYVFFTKNDLNFKRILIPLMLVMIGLLIAIITAFIHEDMIRSLYWATYVVQLIVLQICIYCQLLIDFCRYPLNKQIWQIDYLYRIEVKRVLKKEKSK